jgi:lipid II:glycine glycyltransferase (peptidoglycan interpeptide bridge formation enzyme)
MELLKDAAHWDEIIAGLPGAHILQSREWGLVKARLGWAMLPHVWRSSSGHVQAAAMVLQRTIRMGGFAMRLRMLYVPRGPLLDWADAALSARVLDDLQVLARRRGAILVKIDPEVPCGTGVPGAPDETANPTGANLSEELGRCGWLFSNEQVQFRNTVLVDLSASEENLLSNMKQKTRYNINLAQRKGVSVRIGASDDFDLLYRMYAETSVRDGFVIRDRQYYMHVWQTFLQAGMLEPLIAEVAEQPVAGVMIFRFAGRAWYFYGMSRAAHREKMPNHLLQWEAMRRARAAGCRVYDLWGAPDIFNEGDSMWGVYRFKEGLGGKVLRTLGAWDFPAQPLLYRFYARILPGLLARMRRRGQARTQQEVSL